VPTAPRPPDPATPAPRRGPRFADTHVTRLTFKALRLMAGGARLVLQTLVALIIVFEEWGWRPLAAALAQLARLKPFAWIEAQIQRLPPYGALLVFGAPSLLLLPLKLVALFLIASGREFEATLLFIGAKIVGTAIVARLFQLTEAQLLRIPWFARVYGVFMPWKNALTAWIHDSWPWRYGRVVKERVRRLMRPIAQAVRAEAALFLARVRGWLGRT
jgi:hypothetical protein